MSAIVIDTECSGALRNNAHPFDRRNYVVALGCYNPNTNSSLHYYDNDDDVSTHIRNHIPAIQKDSLVVGFNLKFDLHWLRRYGITLLDHKLWDCQLAEFILSNQRTHYPSLNIALSRYNLPAKKDILQKYLDEGKDVNEIPKDELLEYLQHDLESTYQLFLRQQEDINKQYRRIFSIQCVDLHVLQEMEWNGMKYDFEKSAELSNSSRGKEKELIKKLNDLVNVQYINWNSGDHVSTVLYGGELDIEARVPVGVYKTGTKAGQPRFKVEHHKHPLPRLVEPLKGSELKKEGYWSTAEPILTELKAKGVAGKIVKLLLELSKLDKERSTYFDGIPKKAAYFGWNDSMIHGQINQCVAVTGRTSSSNPNLQNIPENGRECFVSRYS